MYVMKIILFIRFSINCDFIFFTVMLFHGLSNVNIIPFLLVVVIARLFRVD